MTDRETYVFKKPREGADEVVQFAYSLSSSSPEELSKRKKHPPRRRRDTTGSNRSSRRSATGGTVHHSASRGMVRPSDGSDADSEQSLGRMAGPFDDLMPEVAMPAQVSGYESAANSIPVSGTRAADTPQIDRATASAMRCSGASSTRDAHYLEKTSEFDVVEPQGGGVDPRPFKDGSHTGPKQPLAGVMSTPGGEVKETSWPAASQQAMLQYPERGPSREWVGGDAPSYRTCTVIGHN